MYPTYPKMTSQPFKMLVCLVLANGLAQRKNFKNGVVPGRALHPLYGSAETLPQENLSSLAILLTTYKSNVLATATFSSSTVQKPCPPSVIACDL